MQPSQKRTCSNEHEEEQCQLLNDQGDDDEVSCETMNTLVGYFSIVDEDQIVLVNSTFDQHVDQACPMRHVVTLERSEGASLPMGVISGQAMA